MDQEILTQYANLVVKVGVNLQKDQILVIQSPIGCADFAHCIAEAAFDAGAHDVVVSWADEDLAHLRFQRGKTELFREFPDWRHAFYTDYAEQGAAFVSIAANSPGLFQDVDPQKMQLAAQAAGAALSEYRTRMMKNQNTWCVVSVPTPAWAKKVFPDLTSDEAVQKLWQAILSSLHYEKGKDLTAIWHDHIAAMQRTAAFLNEHQFRRLHYTNGLGTDLTVELPEGHIWAGGAEESTTGVLFAANMPTEEVYTAPKRDGVNGTVVATRPLNFAGNVIEDFRLTFQDGEVVDFDAKKGKEALKTLLTTDKGSCRLGEAALVPYDSPISRGGVLFYNTLFDENASCHLAFGKAYPTSIKDGEKMDTEELLKRGLNDSLLHEDFMVGSRDLCVTGVLVDGTEVPVMKEGNFAF